MNIKEAIEKLQSIEIDAKDLDPRKIDSEKLKGMLQDRPNLFLIIILITLTLSATIFLVIQFKNKKQDLLTQLTEQQQKLSIINEQKKIQAQYDTFIEELPETISTENLIAQLNEFALENDIKILNFSPGNPDINKNIEFENVRINVLATTYDNLIAFSKSIENSDISVRFDSFQATPHKENNNRATRTSSPTDEIPIEIGISLTTIKINP